MWGLDAAANDAADRLPLERRHDPAGAAVERIPEDGTVAIETTASFDIWQSEPGTLFCSLDDAEFTPCTTPAVYLGLLDGPHTFEAYVQDRAGNVSITGSRTWIVDTVP